MSEFKAQILGIIIVISLFVLVSAGVTKLFNSTWTKIEQMNSSAYQMAQPSAKRL